MSNYDWIKDVGGDKLAEALISIARSHGIKESEIRDYVEGRPSDEELDLAVVIHTVVCRKDHDVNRPRQTNELSLEEEVCYWDIEDSLTRPWEGDAHKDFLKKAVDLCKLIDANPAELAKMIRDIYRSPISEMFASLQAAVANVFFPNIFGKAVGIYYILTDNYCRCEVPREHGGICLECGLSTIVKR